MSYSLVSTPDIPDLDGTLLYNGLQLLSDAAGDKPMPGLSLLHDVACPSLGMLLHVVQLSGGLDGLQRLKATLTDEEVLMNRAHPNPSAALLCKRPTPPAARRTPSGGLPPVQPPSRSSQRGQAPLARKASALYSPLDRLTQKKNIDLSTNEGLRSMRTLDRVSNTRKARAPTPPDEVIAASVIMNSDMFPSIPGGNAASHVAFIGLVDKRQMELRQQLEAVHERSIGRESERRSKGKGRRGKHVVKLPALAASNGKAAAMNAEGNRGRLLHEICKTYHSRVM